MLKFINYLLIVALGVTTCISLAQEHEFCSEKGPCYCKTKNGIINLQPLGNTNGTMRFSDITNINLKDISISYNPCYPATIQTQKDIQNQECKNVAACMVNRTNSPIVQYQVAVQDKYAFFKNENVTVILYSELSGSRNRDVFVELNCSKNTKVPTLELIDALEIRNHITYVYMKLTSICACPGECPMEIPKTPSKSVSFGSVLLIFFSIGFLLYLIGGMIYNHRTKHAAGCELLPNFDFWTSFPGLVMDGVRFTCSCCQKKKLGTAYDEA